MLNDIMDYLTPHRMMTVENLALNFEMPAEKMQIYVNQLAAAGRVRAAQSTCNGACSSCSGCGTEDDEMEAPPVDPNAIIISLEMARDPND